MGFFSRLFGPDKESDTKIREAIRAEINISECIDAHMKWKGRLQNYVDGTSKEQLDPNRARAHRHPRGARDTNGGFDRDC